jgi:hypothetical protein
VQTTVAKKGPGQRKIFEGWNNLSDLERNGLAEVLEFFKDEKYNAIPESFRQREREVLRFHQANEFNCLKTANMLLTHFEWRGRTLPCKLTENVIRLLVKNRMLTLEGHRLPVRAWQGQAL